MNLRPTQLKHAHTHSSDCGEEGVMLTVAHVCEWMAASLSVFFFRYSLLSGEIETWAFVFPSLILEIEVLIHSNIYYVANPGVTLHWMYRFIVTEIHSYVQQTFVCLYARCVLFTVACTGAESFTLVPGSPHCLPERSTFGFWNSNGFLGVYKLFTLKYNGWKYFKVQSNVLPWPVSQKHQVTETWE